MSPKEALIRLAEENVSRLREIKILLALIIIITICFSYVSYKNTKELKQQRELLLMQQEAIKSQQKLLMKYKE